MVDFAEQVSPQPVMALRTGRVVEIASAGITVDIGQGQLLAMPYLTSYVPILGDWVQVLQQGASVFALGAPAGMPADNVLSNGSFELDPPGTSGAQYWTFATTATGTASATGATETATAWGPKDGTQWFEISHSPTGNVTAYLVSEPIPVTPGEYWSAAGYAISAEVPSLNDNSAMEIRLAFHTNATDVYPTGALSMAVVHTINGPTGSSWQLIRAPQGGGAVVPQFATHMRVVLATLIASGYVYWDAITCRRIRAV